MRAIPVQKCPASIWRGGFYREVETEMREQRHRRAAARILALCLCAGMALAAFAGCGKKDDKKTAKSQSSSAPAKTMYINPLTGTETEDSYVTQNRPVAVMINNIKAALPQYGIGSADILYEVVAEGGITRMLALYTDYRAVPKIGSVRSARPYYIALAQGHGATLIHYGTSWQADDLLYENGIETVDGMALSETAFFFDEERWESGYNREHCSFTGSDYITAGLQAKDISLAGTPRTAFHFYGAKENVSPFSYGKAAEVTFSFSGYADDRLVYDTQTDTYQKYEYGQPQVDQASGATLAFTNAFLLFDNIYVISDEGHMGCDLEAGTGYYFTGGAYKPISWKKGGLDDALTLYEEDGSELKVRPGQSYIAIVGENMRDALQVTPGQQAQGDTSSTSQQ
ncbi:Putative lipoprotein yerB precursor [Anaerotruncus sp. 2789STDY5834896]|uniref:Putative lipoprotein yerB n=1 Tax=uncultured Anaerotruncus sp. TaxID=905011 RepID=A0A1C6J5R5_9FIRM|nr:Putative lipoprotein yerB precursor [uncultured Anaerotruncus sp.]